MSRMPQPCYNVSPNNNTFQTHGIFFYPVNYMETNPPEDPHSAYPNSMPFSTYNNYPGVIEANSYTQHIPPHLANGYILLKPDYLSYYGQTYVSSNGYKPHPSYISLISAAILESMDKKLVLSDIYQYILDRYPYFRDKNTGWRNSVRHNLSLNECFLKCGRSLNGKGHYWSVHPANIEDFKRGDFSRRKAQKRIRTHLHKQRSIASEATTNEQSDSDAEKNVKPFDRDGAKFCQLNDYAYSSNILIPNSEDEIENADISNSQEVAHLDERETKPFEILRKMPLPWRPFHGSSLNKPKIKLDPSLSLSDKTDLESFKINYERKLVAKMCQKLKISKNHMDYLKERLNEGDVDLIHPVLQINNQLYNKCDKLLDKRPFDVANILAP